MMNKIQTIEWIDVKSAVPEYDKRVILCTNKGIILGKRRSTDKSGHHYDVESSFNTYWNSFTVSYWAKLPEPPIKDK